MLSLTTTLTLVVQERAAPAAVSIIGSMLGSRLTTDEGAADHGDS